MKKLIVLIAALLFIFTIAGCASLSNIGQKGDIEIIKLVFSQNAPTGYQQYVEREDTTFKYGEVAFVYFEWANIKTVKGDEGEEAWIAENFTLIDPNGDEVYTVEIFHQHVYLPFDFGPDILWVYNYLPIKFGTILGEYTIIIELKDNMAEKSDKKSIKFTIIE